MSLFISHLLKERDFKRDFKATLVKQSLGVTLFSDGCRAYRR